MKKWAREVHHTSLQLTGIINYVCHPSQLLGTMDSKTIIGRRISVAYILTSLKDLWEFS